MGWNFNGQIRLMRSIEWLVFWTLANGWAWCLQTVYRWFSSLFTSALQTLPAAGETLLEHTGITSHFLDEEAISLGEVILLRSLGPLVVVVEQRQRQGFGAPHECPCHVFMENSSTFLPSSSWNMWTWNRKFGPPKPLSCYFTFPPCTLSSPVSFPIPFISFGMYLSVSRVLGLLVCANGAPIFYDLVGLHYILDMGSYLYF